MTTLMIWASIGACGTGAVLAVIAIGWLLDRWASRPAELGGQHRAEEPLPPAHVEVIRVGPLTLVPEIQERTEELPVRVDLMPRRVWHAGQWMTPELDPVVARAVRRLADEDPVEHVEVSETSEPLADVFVPLDAEDDLPRSLGHHVTAMGDGDERHHKRIDGALRGFHARLDASGANARIDEWLRDGGRLPGLAEARRAAFADVDDPSIEIPVGEFEALLAEAKAGAVR